MCAIFLTILATSAFSYLAYNNSIVCLVALQVEIVSCGTVKTVLEILWDLSTDCGAS